MDYRSEMMRRDINGKLDGDRLKRGEFTEGSVTILAPLVVGRIYFADLFLSSNTGGTACRVDAMAKNVGVITCRVDAIIRHALVIT
jgi:hypothetical protein